MDAEKTTLNIRVNEAELTERLNGIMDSTDRLDMLRRVGELSTFIKEHSTEEPADPS